MPQNQSWMLPWPCRPKSAQLAEKLLESLDEDVDEQVDQAQIDAAWAQEAERRLADCRAGKIGSVPAEELFAMLRTKYTK